MSDELEKEKIRQMFSTTQYIAESIQEIKKLEICPKQAQFGPEKKI